MLPYTPNERHRSSLLLFCNSKRLAEVSYTHFWFKLSPLLGLDFLIISGSYTFLYEWAVVMSDRMRNTGVVLTSLATQLTQLCPQKINTNSLLVLVGWYYGANYKGFDLDYDYDFSDRKERLNSKAVKGVRSKNI